MGQNASPDIEPYSHNQLIFDWHISAIQCEKESYYQQTMSNQLDK